MICKICGKEVKVKGFDSHLRGHHISNKNYYDIYEKKPGDGICKTCGNPTTYMGATSGYKKFCSPRCAQRDDNTREACRKTCIERYGVENPFQAEECKKKD